MLGTGVKERNDQHLPGLVVNTQMSASRSLAFVMDRSGNQTLEQDQTRLILNSEELGLIVCGPTAFFLFLVNKLPIA